MSSPGAPRAYLDHAATTPLRPEVFERMVPYLTEHYGNPSSAHSVGRRAAAALEDARDGVAEALGVHADEVFFVRGGTEADNLAVLGWAGAVLAEDVDVTPRVIVSAIEHKAVLEAAAEVGRIGGEVVVMAVGTDASLDTDSIPVVPGGPTLVSAMWVNNETGTILAIPELADLCAEHGATLHTDAVQAVGKIPVDLSHPGIGLASITGHKLGGPKGTGALIVRRSTRVHPLLHGGGQERGLRPGTEDVAGAVGFAEAVRMAVEERGEVMGGVEALRDRIESEVGARLPGVVVHGGGGPRSPHIANLGIPSRDGPALVAALDLAGVSVSGGSACNSGAGGGSHVIRALYGDDHPAAPLRFSLSPRTRADEVDQGIAGLFEALGLGGSEPGAPPEAHATGSVAK